MGPGNLYVDFAVVFTVYRGDFDFMFMLAVGWG